MQDEESGEFVDARSRGWWWASNDLFAVAPAIGPSAFLVYCSLCHHANADRTCWPSRRRVRAMTGLSLSTISVAFSRLTKHGLIGLERMPREDGSLGVYRFTLRDAPRLESGGGAPESGGPSSRIQSTPPPEFSPRNKTQLEQDAENKTARRRRKTSIEDFTLPDAVMTWAQEALGMEPRAVAYWFEEWRDAIRAGNFRRVPTDLAASLRNSLRRQVGKPMPGRDKRWTSTKTAGNLEAFRDFVERHEEKKP